MPRGAEGAPGVGGRGGGAGAAIERERQGASQPRGVARQGLGRAGSESHAGRHAGSLLVINGCLAWGGVRGSAAGRQAGAGGLGRPLMRVRAGGTPQRPKAAAADPDRRQRAHPWSRVRPGGVGLVGATRGRPRKGESAPTPRAKPRAQHAAAAAAFIRPPVHIPWVFFSSYAARWPARRAGGDTRRRGGLTDGRRPPGRKGPDQGATTLLVTLARCPAERRGWDRGGAGVAEVRASRASRVSLTAHPPPPPPSPAPARRHTRRRLGRRAGAAWSDSLREGREGAARAAPRARGLPGRPPVGPTPSHRDATRGHRPAPPRSARAGGVASVGPSAGARARARSAPFRRRAPRGRGWGGADLTPHAGRASARPGRRQRAERFRGGARADTTLAAATKPPSHPPPNTIMAPTVDSAANGRQVGKAPRARWRESRADGPRADAAGTPQ
jgi:hypothetical protein